MAKNEFTLPDAHEEVEALRLELVAEVQTIQSQLGDKVRTDRNGRRLSSKEYWQWRREAQHALTQKLEQLRLVKQRIRELNGGNHNNQLRSAVNLLRSVYFMVIHGEDHLKLTPHEKAELERAARFLTDVDV